MSALKPDTDGAHDLGTTAVRWGNLYVDAVTVTDNVVIAGDLTVNGATTQVNTAQIQVKDPIMQLNYEDGSALAGANSGIHVGRSGEGVTDASLIFDEASGDVWKAGLAGSEVEILTLSATQTLTNKTLTSPVLTTPTVTTSLLPTNANTATLGSAAKEFGDLFLGDGGQILFGNDQDVLLTHAADKGLRLSLKSADLGAGSLSHGSSLGGLVSYVESTSPADGDYIGGLWLNGDDDASNETTYASVIGRIKDVTNGTEDGALVFRTMIAGTETTVLDIGDTAAGSAAKFAGSVTAVGSFIIGNADMNEADLEKLDGITNGTAAASKALVLDADKDIGTIRNLTIDGVFTDGNYTFDTSGNVSGLGTVGCGAITATGTSTFATACSPDAADGATLGSASAEWSDLFLADGGQILFGNDQDVLLTHVADKGLRLSLKSADLGAGSLSHGSSLGGLVSYVESTSPADGDYIGGLWLNGDDDASNETTYASVIGRIKDVTNGTEDGALVFRTMIAGTETTVLDIGDTAAGSAAKFAGSVTAVGSFIIGNADMNEADLEKLDGITNGTAAASKALVLDADKDIGTIRNLTIDGVFTDGNYTFDTSGNVSGLGTVGCGAITATGTSTFATACSPDAADSATLGSASAEWSDLFLADGSEILFGNDQDVKLTHVADAGLLLNSTMQLQFGDAATNIKQSADGQLDIDADGEVEITAPTVNLVATTAVTLDTPSVVVASGTSAKPVMELKNTNDDGTGPTLKLALDTDNSAATNDVAGTISFYADDAGNNQTEYARMQAKANAVTAGSESGKLTFGVATTASGAYADIITIAGGATAALSSVTIAGDLTVNGTTTTVDTVTMQAQNAIVFEGATANDFETTLSIVDPANDSNTIYLPDATGYIPLINDASDADGVVTAAEFALLDGGSTVGTTAVSAGDGIFTNDAGTMRHTTVQTFQTYFDANSVGGSSIVTVGALDAGSITSNFGSINNGASAITTTGLGSFGSLDVDDVLINGTTIGHTDDNDLMTLANSALTLKGTLTVGVDDTGHDVKLFGATAGAYLEWDESADELEIRGGAATPGKLLLSTAEATVVDGDKLGQIDFQAPAESSGTDAILVGASIWAEADDTFAADNNDTDLVFATGKSATAAEKMRLNSDGNLNVDGTITGNTSLTLDTTTITTAEIGVLDNVTAGTAAASKALVVDANKDVGTIRNLTIDGVFTDGNYTFDTSGNVTGLGNIDNGSNNITTGGLLKIDVDGTAIGSAGSLTIGAEAKAGLYVPDSDDLIIENTNLNTDIEFKVNNGTSKTMVMLDASTLDTRFRNKITLAVNATLNASSTNVIEMTATTSVEDVSLNVTKGIVKTEQEGSGIEITKKASAKDEADSSAVITDNGVQSSSITLTLNTNLADDAIRTITINNDKVKATSVILVSTNKNFRLRTHTVVSGSFKIEFQNKSGSQIDNDDNTTIFNYVVI